MTFISVHEGNSDERLASFGLAGTGCAIILRTGFTKVCRSRYGIRGATLCNITWPDPERSIELQLVIKEDGKDHRAQIPPISEGHSLQDEQFKFYFVKEETNAMSSEAQ